MNRKYSTKRWLKSKLQEIRIIADTELKHLSDDDLIELQIDLLSKPEKGSGYIYGAAVMDEHYRRHRQSGRIWNVISNPHRYKKWEEHTKTIEIMTTRNMIKILGKRSDKSSQKYIDSLGEYLTELEHKISP